MDEAQLKTSTKSTDSEAEDIKVDKNSKTNLTQDPNSNPVSTVVQQCSKTPSMSVKYKQSDLDIITNKHKLLTSTLCKVPVKLSTANWETWKTDFMIQMRNLKLDKIILGEWEVIVMVKTEFKDADDCAKDNLMFNIADNLRNFIQHEKLAKNMFQKLVDHFEGSKIIRGWRLCKSLVHLLTNKSDKLDKIAFDYQSLVDEFNVLFPSDYLLSDILSKDVVSYDQIIK